MFESLRVQVSKIIFFLNFIFWEMDIDFVMGSALCSCCGNNQRKGERKGKYKYPPFLLFMILSNYHCNILE